ncbi:MAG: NUDIX domain-containing protein [Caldilineaceae bacterium]|nr:NUDIX domain-containing protein [Caldilineaceae bacterium]
MPTLGVSIAVFRGNQILLVKREDFPVWALPGGAVENRESVAQAAIRETQEETGLDVELARLVGVYSRPDWPIGDGSGSHSILFTATVIGGSLSPQPEEVLEVDFFDVMQLPTPILWWHRQPIADAAAGVGGAVAWSQQVDLPFPHTARHISRQGLYALRDQGKLPAAQILAEWGGEPTSKNQVQEVGPGFIGEFPRG